MNNPFGKPRTLRQWLLGSVCWLGSSLGGWLALGVACGVLFPQNHIGHEAGQWLTLGAFIVMHGLLWPKVVFSWRPAQQTDAAGLFLVGGMWLLTLVLFQLACLAYILIGLVFALGEPMSWS